MLLIHGCLCVLWKHHSTLTPSATAMRRKCCYLSQVTLFCEVLGKENEINVSVRIRTYLPQKIAQSHYYLSLNNRYVLYSFFSLLQVYCTAALPPLPAHHHRNTIANSSSAESRSSLDSSPSSTSSSATVPMSLEVRLRNVIRIAPALKNVILFVASIVTRQDALLLRGRLLQHPPPLCFLPPMKPGPVFLMWLRRGILQVRTL